MRHRVLTIEDQPDIRRLIRMTLEFKGYEVLEAGDGETGLQMARRERPDLVLVDVMMPGQSGLEVARELADDPRLQDLPVIMISALGRTQDVEAGLSTGARAYLVKPFSPWELLELTERLTQTAAAGAPAQPT